MLIRSKNKMHLVNIENGVVSAEGEGTVTFRAGKRVQKHDKRSITVSPSRNLGESCFPDAGRK